MKPRTTEWDRMFTREAYEALPSAITAVRPFASTPYRSFDGRSLTWYWLDGDGATRTVTHPAIITARPAYRPRLEGD